jgi:hypothetical protein
LLGQLASGERPMHVAIGPDAQWCTPAEPRTALHLQPNQDATPTQPPTPRGELPDISACTASFGGPSMLRRTPVFGGLCIVLATEALVTTPKPSSVLRTTQPGGGSRHGGSRARTMTPQEHDCSRHSGLAYKHTIWQATSDPARYRLHQSITPLPSWPSPNSSPFPRA